MSAQQAFDERSDWESNRSHQRHAAVQAARRSWQSEAYRQTWTAAGIRSAEDIDEAHWNRLPLLSKEDLVEAARRAPPWGTRLLVDRTELGHIFVAPGPLYMPFTANDLDHVAGSFAKALSACGIQATDLVDQTTMYNWVIAASVLDRALGRIGCAVLPGGIGQTERHIEVISQLGVNAILAFPTFLEHLLEQAAATGQRLPLTKAAVMGELSDPKAKSRILDKYGVQAREFYGVADAGAVAWECEAGLGMHLRDDLLVEFVAPGSSELVAPSPTQPAEIVVTDFYREAMPIIRLRTGDMVDGLTHERCSCGRQSPRFSRIVGRASEITKVKGMFVVPRLVQDVMHRLGLERRYRLVVERAPGGQDSLGLEVAGAPYPDPAAFQLNVEQSLRMRIDLRFVDELPEGGPRLLDRRFLP